MRTLASFLPIALLLLSAGPARTQPGPRHLDLEVEPLAYAFGGAGGHVGLQVGRWKYEVEAFGLTVPEPLHGNDAFEASLRGAGLHAEHFFGEDLQGFYAGPEASVAWREVTHSESGNAAQKILYSVGIRGGYRWYTGLGNLYISPVAGVSYTLNGEPVTVGGDTFETAPLGPWGTVGVGWSFGR
ncbi:MAG: hypothetical protein ABEK84_09705 [Salinibacter sp.]